MSMNGGAAFAGIAGLDDEGAVPARFSDECLAALAAANALLAASGLSLHDARHIACVVRDADAFARCQTLVSEALGPARPSVTLRVVHRFERAEQRIALGVTAVL